MTKQFRGVYAVTCTPFGVDGEVDEAALRRHVRWLLDEGGVQGMIPAGSTGEFAFLSEAERRQVTAVVIDEVGGKVPVIAGAAACATRDTVRFSQMAQELGANGVMVVPPYYGHLSQEELFVHFKTLAANIDIPVMLYNNPGASGSDILPETVARLAPLPRIAAIKESTGIMQRVTEIQSLCGEQIEVLCGCDTLPLEMFLVGVEGWVAAPSNTIARQCVELYRLAVEEKNIPKARELYLKLLPLFALFEGSGQYVQLNKCALEMLGRPIGQPRTPLLPPAMENQARLRQILAGLGLIK
jgi:4-hydroxy-tetrahydrodipicolinate synthase